MLKERKEKSVKVKTTDKIIIIMIMLSFAGAVIISFLSYNKTKEEQIKFVERSLKQYSKEYKNYIEDYFEYNFKILEFLTTFNAVKSMEWETQYNFLKDKSEALNFEHFIVMDNNGYGHYTNRNEIKDQSHEQFYRDVIDNNRFITEPFMEEFENRSITTLSVSIIRDGTKIGSLCGVIDLDKIYKIFGDIDKESYDFAFLINNLGDYIAHSDMKYVHEKLNVFEQLNNKDSDLSFLKEGLDLGKSSLGEVKLDGIEYYASFVHLDVTEWSLVCLIPKHKALIVLKKFILFQGMIIIFGFLILLLGINIIYKTIENYKLAHTDSLTGLNNRASFSTKFDKLDFDFTKSISIICFDLNDFKYINDTFGHHLGDRVLAEFADILEMTIGEEGFIARTGGDEFIVILENNNKESIEYHINNIITAISKYNKDNEHKLEVSYGFATREKGSSDSLYSIQEKADKNMYEYKKIIKMKYKNELH